MNKSRINFFILISLSFLSFKSFAVTKDEAERCIKRYYYYIQEYADDISKTPELTEKIRSLFIDGKGSVYNDIFTRLDKNPDTDGDVLSYLSSIDKHRKEHLRFSVENVVVIIEADNTAHLEYDKTVSGGMWIYTIEEEAIIKNGKIVCIYKKGSGKNRISPVKINLMSFAGADRSGKKMLTSYSTTLSNHNFPYIKVKIDYKAEINTKVKRILTYPNGRRQEFSVIELEKNDNTYISNYYYTEEGRYFSSGTYKFELLDESSENVFYSQTFVIDDYIEVSDADLFFNADGGIDTITVSSNAKWEISMDTVSWCHLTRLDNELFLKVDRNTSVSERTDFFKLKTDSKEIRVTIKQEGRNLYVSEPYLYFDADGGGKTITVTSNYDWSCTCECDWIYYSVNENKLNIHVLENDNNKRRESIVKVRSDKNVVDVKIKQYERERTGLSNYFHFDDCTGANLISYHFSPKNQLGCSYTHRIDGSRISLGVMLSTSINSFYGWNLFTSHSGVYGTTGITITIDQSTVTIEETSLDDGLRYDKYSSYIDPYNEAVHDNAIFVFLGNLGLNVCNGIMIEAGVGGMCIWERFYMSDTYKITKTVTTIEDCLTGEEMVEEPQYEYTSNGVDKWYRGDFTISPAFRLGSKLFVPLGNFDIYSCSIVFGGGYTYMPTNYKFSSWDAALGFCWYF